MCPIEITLSDNICVLYQKQQNVNKTLSNIAMRSNITVYPFIMLFIVPNTVVALASSFLFCDRDADLGHKFSGVAGKALVDERDLTRKAGEPQTMLCHELLQPSILFRRLNMMPMKTDANAERLRQREKRTIKAVSLIQQQERSVISYSVEPTICAFFANVLSIISLLFSESKRRKFVITSALLFLGHRAVQKLGAVVVKLIDFLILGEEPVLDFLIGT